MARGKAKAAKVPPAAPKKVPSGHYFCLVDNRHHSAHTKIGVEHRRYARESNDVAASKS